MSIKKSFLEQKLFYRIAKVFFLLLPFLVVTIIFFKGYINIVYIAIGLALYFLILKGIWRIFLYIAFGGLEDDTKKKVSEAVRSVNPAIQPTPAPVQNNGLGILFFIIFIILVIYIATYTGTPQKSQSNNNGNKTSQCVPTGCGALWYSSCTKKCYSNQSDCRQTLTYEYGCASGGSCRQCP